MQTPLSVNTYAKLGKPTVTETISVYDWFNKIKQSDYSDTITTTRKNHPKGSPEYDKVKRSMPCVTYNFLFDGYKNNKGIIGATGLMFIDIDCPQFNIESLNLTQVLACYKSFGGVGYSIVVRVNGLTLTNFTTTYNDIINQLELSAYFDDSARKATQFNVLSFDDNIYINDNPFIFKAIQNSTPPCVIKKKRKHIHTEGGKNDNNTIRFDDIDRIHVEGDYVVNWDGYDNIKCFIPMKKFKAGSRNKFLLGYCNNFVYLNPNVNIEHTQQILDKVNKVACEPPVNFSQIIRVTSSIYKYKKDGTLEPKYFFRKRKIVFSKDCTLNPVEKLKKCGAEWNKKQIETSRQKLYDILEGWDFDKYGKITQPKTYAKHHPISKKTVEKYWKEKEFKEYIKALNADYKERCKSIAKTVESIELATPKATLDGIKLNENVDIVTFMMDMYNSLGSDIDFETISDFRAILNCSNATVEEVIHQMSKIYDINKLPNSEFKHIRITKQMLELIQQNSESLIAA